jgi:hypothetical protein
VFEFSSPKLCLARLLRFCYKTGFTEMEIVQFYALLTRRKPGLDSIICSLWDSIQNALNWLLTSGSMVRVHHGSSILSTTYGRFRASVLLWGTFRVTKRAPSHLFYAPFFVDFFAVFTSLPYCGQFLAFLYPAACASPSVTNGGRLRSVFCLLAGVGARLLFVLQYSMSPE